MKPYAVSSAAGSRRMFGQERSIREFVSRVNE